MLVGFNGAVTVSSRKSARVPLCNSRRSRSALIPSFLSAWLEMNTQRSNPSFTHPDRTHRASGKSSKLHEPTCARKLALQAARWDRTLSAKMTPAILCDPLWRSASMSNQARVISLPRACGAFLTRGTAKPSQTPRNLP